MFLLVFTVCFIYGCERTGGASLPLSSPKTIQITGVDKGLSIKWTNLASAQNVAPIIYHRS